MASELVYVSKEGIQELYARIREIIPSEVIIDDVLDIESGNAISNRAVTAAIGNLTGFKVSYGTGPDNHPDEEHPDNRTLYLVKIDDASGEDKYKEWIYSVDDTWECIGSTSVNMDDYVRKVQGADGNLGVIKEGTLADSGISADEVDDALDKLAGIEAGAEVDTIRSISVNGTPTVPDASRNVDIVIPNAIPDPTEAKQVLYSYNGVSWGLGAWKSEDIDVPTDEEILIIDGR
jgi:hypothetical protein